MEKETRTYQQLLAEVYEETAPNTLVYAHEHLGDDSYEYNVDKHEENDLEDKEEFNKFQGARGKPEHVIKPDAKHDSGGKAGVKHQTDVRTIVLNIDGAFRGNIVPQNPTNCNGTVNEGIVIGTNSSHFTFNTNRLYKNISSVKLTSMEFMNSFYTFSAARGNTTFYITLQSNSSIQHTITIPDGNYSACEMEETLTKIISEIPEISWLTVKFNPENGHFEFTGSQLFAIDPSHESKDRMFDYGLGYYLGFSRCLHRATQEGTEWKVVSTFPANFAGDSYIFLRINDYTCVRHTFNGNSLNVFAKIIINQSKNDMSFDDYAGDHIKEVVLTGPEDLRRLHIQVLDAYGEIMDLTCTNFSFSLEILEVMNVNLFNAFRNSLSMPYLLTDPARSGGPPTMI
jgi:hypothetical protein